MNTRFKQVRNQMKSDGGDGSAASNTGQTPIDGDANLSSAKTAAPAAETGQLKTGDPAAEIKT